MLVCMQDVQFELWKKVKSVQKVVLSANLQNGRQS